MYTAYLYKAIIEDLLRHDAEEEQNLRQCLKLSLSASGEPSRETAEVRLGEGFLYVRENQLDDATRAGKEAFKLFCQFEDDNPPLRAMDIPSELFGIGRPKDAEEACHLLILVANKKKDPKEAMHWCDVAMKETKTDITGLYRIIVEKADIMFSIGQTKEAHIFLESYANDLYRYGTEVPSKRLELLTKVDTASAIVLSSNFIAKWARDHNDLILEKHCILKIQSICRAEGLRSPLNQDLGSRLTLINEQISKQEKQK